MRISELDLTLHAQNSLSTMWPTRRSIIDGTGSPDASSAAALPPPAAFSFFLPPSAASVGFFSFSFFSFLDVFASGALASAGALSAGAASLPFLPLAAGAAEAEAGAASLGAFSFFGFGGSALRSTFGAFSRSKATSENAGASDAAAFRTCGRFWMWSK